MKKVVMVRNIIGYFLNRGWFVRSKSFKGYSRKLTIFIQITDILLIGLIHLITWNIFKYWHPEWQPFFNFRLLLFTLIQLVVWYALLQIANLPKIPRTTRTLVLLFNVFRINLIGTGVLILVKFSLTVSQVPVAMIMLFSFISVIVYSIVHIITVRMFRIYRSRGYDIHRVLVFADTYSEDFLRRILEQKDWGFEIAGIVTNSRVLKGKFEGILPVFSAQKDPLELIRTLVIDEVIYSRSRIIPEEFKKIILYCIKTGIIFRMQSDLSPINDLKIRLEQLHRIPDLVFLNQPGNNTALFLKTFSDLVVSITLVFLLLPVFAVIAIAIKIDSPGPVFFQQKRVGLRGREFYLYKFRTMVKDAEAMKQKLMAANEMDGPVFKIKNDPRVTGLGKFLRQTGLDELPQLFNVVNGEMSLIGPRPPLPEEVKNYESDYLRRLSVKPGITCTWQVMPNRNSVRFEQWMKLDLEYIDKWSTRLDILIFLKTFRTVLMRTGA